MIWTHDELYQRQMETVSIQFEHFMEHDLFTWKWWVLLLLSIVPWLIWIWKRERGIQNRLLFGAMIVAMISLVFDVFGTQFGWWVYGVKLIPSIPPLLPYDLAVMPVEYLLIQQWAKNQKQFNWCILGIAFFNAFVAETLLSWMDVYQTVIWKKYYSFPIYFLIFYLASKVANQESGWQPFYPYQCEQQKQQERKKP